MSDELRERAKIIAEATGRTIEDVLEDLGDDGILNDSNKSEKDLITQLKEAAELISTVQQINHEVSENTVLNGGDNKTDVTLETTLEGDIVDRAIESVNRKVQNLKKIAIIILPVFLILTGGTLEGMGFVNMLDDEPAPYEEYNMDYGACLNPDADNYDEYASWDDGSCYWDDEPNPPECNPEWFYDDTSYQEEYNITVQFSFEDREWCGVEIDGHFIISITKDDNSYDEDFVDIEPFRNLIDIQHEFTDLEEGSYEVNVELHEVSCHSDYGGTCDHSEEWESVYNPSFWIDERVIYGCTDDSADNYNDEATEDDGSCTYPEPPCNGTASFYDVTYLWQNETNDTINLRLMWDADWSCEETQEIEIDIYLQDNNSSAVYSNTVSYSTTGMAGDNKYLIISNISKPIDGFKLSMNIWVDINGYRNDDTWTRDLE